MASVNWFKQRREALRLTQQRVADALGVTSALVSAWERGIAVPQVWLLADAADVYRVSVADLVKAIGRIDRPKTRRVPA